MGIFNLSNNLLDLENPKKDPVKIFYFLPSKFSKNLQNSVLYSSMWTLDRYYNLKKFDLDIGFQHSIDIREIIKNARWHGGSKDNHPTHFGLFMNADKFCLGCNDGGDYFKRQDIKEIWENKRELKEFHKSDNPEIGFHIGYNHIKGRFDEIKVDTEYGTFYGVVEIKNFLIRIKNIDD